MDRREIDRLLITCPPRHGKSEQVTIRRPAFKLERDAGLRFIVGAYNSRLAKKFSRRTRGIVRTRGKVALSPDLQAADEWETELHGGLRAAGVGTGVTGEGCDELLIDDPVKSRAEANSQSYKETCWDWYRDDLYTRLEPDGNVILIMTRWAEDDLAGRILASDDANTWTICHMPAFAEDNDQLGRSIGEALCPERYDEAKLERIQKVLGASFDALYQGRPAPAEGNIILGSWILRYQMPEAHYRLRVQSWDTANKDNELNDWSVCTTWGVGANTYDLLDEHRERYQLPALIAAIKSEAERHAPDAILIEDKGSGTGALQFCRAETRLPVIAIEPEGNKVMRMVNESPAYEAGLVRHPTETAAPWVAPFENELKTFPNAANDDRVDSVSQFLRWAKRNAGRLVFASNKRDDPYNDDFVRLAGDTNNFM